MSRDVSKRSGLPIVHEFAAGIDVGARFHVVAVPPHITTQPKSNPEYAEALRRGAELLRSVGHEF